MFVSRSRYINPFESFNAESIHFDESLFQGLRIFKYLFKMYCIWGQAEIRASCITVCFVVFFFVFYLIPF